jgi:hypothetical protein
VDFGYFIVVLFQLVDKLGGIEHAVGSSRLENLTLLVDREILPFERWANMLLEKTQDLVVRDGTRIGLQVLDLSSPRR